MKSLDFQVGWLNIERLFFAVALVVFLFYSSVYFFTAVDIPESSSVKYKIPAELNKDPLPPASSLITDKLVWNVNGRLPFFVLETPEIEIPSPNPPTGTVPMFNPAPYPHPGSRGPLTPREGK